MLFYRGAWCPYCNPQLGRQARARPRHRRGRQGLAGHGRRRRQEQRRQGRLPLGSLGGQLAETDPEARALIAAGFARWSAAIRDGLRAQASGRLPAGVSPDDLAVTLLAALQGGLLLAQVQRDTRSLEPSFDTILALAAPVNPPAATAAAVRGRHRGQRPVAAHAKPPSVRDNSKELPPNGRCFRAP